MSPSPGNRVLPSGQALQTHGGCMAHVVTRFPCLTETFVESDIRCTKAVWHRTVILAFRRGREAPPPWVDEVLIARAGWLYPRSQLHFLRTKPATYLRLLQSLVMGHRDDLRELLKVLVVWPAVVHMAYLASRHRVDAVHAHWASLPATAALVITSLLDKPFLFSAHAYDIYLRRAFLSEKLTRAELCITCTDSNRLHLLATLPALRPGKIVVSHHGVDVERFVPGPPPGTLPFVLLTVGRATWQKGFPTLLRAVATCASWGMDLRLAMLAMPGPSSERIRSMISELGIGSRVTWVSTRAPNEMPALYHAAHAFALPCEIGPGGERDGIPNVLAEAMACGLPVISTPVGGIPEILEHEITGLLVPPQEPQQLAREIRRLYESPDLCRRLGSSARAWVVEGFSRQTCQKRLVAIMSGVYDDFEASKAGRPSLGIEAGKARESELAVS